MKETKFLVLTHAGMCVNEDFLAKGIYTAITPKLYTPTETMENLIKMHKDYQGMFTHPETIDIIIKNLKKCTLTPVELKF